SSGRVGSVSTSRSLSPCSASSSASSPAIRAMPFISRSRTVRAGLSGGSPSSLVKISRGLHSWNSGPRPHAPTKAIDCLREWLKDHPEARLVIIDILARFRPHPKNGEQLYHRDYRAGQAL